MEQLAIFLLILMYIGLVLFSIFIIVMFYVFLVLVYTKVPYTPAPLHWIEKILDELKVKKGQVLYDLGCGDGRMVKLAAERGLEAYGYELSPTAYLHAVWNVRSLKNAKILYGDFYSVDYKDADIVYFFLTKHVISDVENKILRKLKKGTKVVSYGNKLKVGQLKKVIDTDTKKDHAAQIYFYEV